VLRELTALINKGLEMQEGIQEVELLVDVAKRSISKVKKEIKAIMCTRFRLEEDFVKRLKKYQSLWDGSRLMAPADRKRWEEEHKERKWEERRLLQTIRYA
jgi:hypothetical protein